MSNSDPLSAADVAVLDAHPLSGKHPTGHPESATAALLVKVSDDPWSLTHGERQTLHHAFAAAQSRWLSRIRDLVEPPTPDPSFPAFLLDTPPFAHLAGALGHTLPRHDLDTGTLDELQRFVDHYRTYHH